MGKIKKKYEAGAATQYISRKQACRKLQLSLADFRRLCILKGIYPHEPVHKKRVNKGSTTNKTFYFLKDIQFLLHEPVINKFREYKIYVRRLKKAEARLEKGIANHIRENKPTYRIDHIVRERYPNFIDAVRDLDDALCMCFLFATLPKSGRLHIQTIDLCRKLTVEFMHYVIATRSLRKVFVSIKGFYFQAEVMSQPVTWIIPHSFPHNHPTDVDFRVMSTFTEFYTAMLGFVLYKLYQTQNLHYPPRIPLLSNVNVTLNDDNKKRKRKEEIQSLCDENEKSLEVVASLNMPLAQFQDANDQEEDAAADEEVQDLLKEGLTETQEEDQKKSEDEIKQRKLFEGCKMFLSREVPREAMVFIIRSFGGEVSWDITAGLGSTFSIDDEKITHQIVDRPMNEKPYISRYYVQPQWIFDSVNAKMQLPVKGYLPGDVLPPHLSPFVNEENGAYVPPERQKVIALQRGEDPGINADEDELSEEDESEEEQEEEDGEGDEENVEENIDEENESPVVAITPGKKDVDRKLNPDQIAAEEKRLAVMMIPKKQRRLYEKIKYGERRKKREAEQLTQKRKAIDDEKKATRKKEKRRKRAA
uniref:Pescadillo homolog n=1 Tax=Phallusia mammillata TaxID=59560 RepID=A0A6F9DNR5_9ASCI|nr:pescadillo homolog [Phallusia mammillata]